MDKRPSSHKGKPSVWSVVQLVLSLCALVATSVAAILWNPIDADFINRADNAGWDESVLLPHQMELSLVLNASVLATFAVVVTAIIGVLGSPSRTVQAGGLCRRPPKNARRHSRSSSGVPNGSHTRINDHPA